MSDSEEPTGTLDCSTSGTHLEAAHRQILDGLLTRGDQSPEREPGEVLEGEWEERAVAFAANNWRDRMVHEHESAAVFTGLLPQLMEAEAALDFKTVIVRSGLDELRHAGLCGQVVEYLGGEPTAEANLEIAPVPQHTDCTPLEGVLRNVVFASCLSETVSMALLTSERERAEEPFVERVLRQLAGDESLHARLGWVFLSTCWQQTDGACAEAIADYLPVAFGAFEESMRSAMPTGHVPDDILAEAVKLGCSSGRQGRSILYETVDEVIIPQLEEIGLPARQAWHDRTTGSSVAQAMIPL